MLWRYIALDSKAFVDKAFSFSRVETKKKLRKRNLKCSSKSFNFNIIFSFLFSAEKSFNPGTISSYLLHNCAWKSEEVEKDKINLLYAKSWAKRNKFLIIVKYIFAEKVL